MKRTTPWGAALAIVVLATLLWANRGFWAADLHETLDLAANSLLVQDAKSGRLLTGNYSRLGFYHPGPAILYMLAAGEAVFHDGLHWVASSIAGQLLAVCAYSTLWMTLTYVLLARMLGSASLALTATCVALAATAMRDPQYLVSLWFPYLYYAPFLAFTAAVARLSSGRLDGLWVLCLAGGVLIHGHVSFVAITGLMVVGAAVAFVACLALRTQVTMSEELRAEATTSRRSLVASVAITAAMLLPVVLHTLLEFPGEIGKYLAYRQGVPPHSVLDALRFVWLSWGYAPVAVFVSAAIALAIASGRGGMQPLMGACVAVLWSIALASLALAVYARTGIDLLNMTYTSLFYFAAIALGIGTSVAAVVSLLPNRAKLVAWLASAGGLIVFAAIAQPAAVTAEPIVATLFNQIASGPVKPVVLDLDSREPWWESLWGVVAGSAAHAERLHQRPFCVRMNWHLLFTERWRCSDIEAGGADRVLVTKHPDPSMTGVHVGDLMLVASTPPPIPYDTQIMLVPENSLQASRLLVQGWHSPEPGLTWSKGERSMMQFVRDRAGPFTLALDLTAFLPTDTSRQTTTVLVNGKEVGALEFSAGDNARVRTVAVVEEVAGPAGVVTVELVTANPTSPAAAGKGADPRVLGLALRSLRILR